MKKYIVIIILFLAIVNIEAFSQSFKDLSEKMNSYKNKGDFDNALIWAYKALIQAEKEFGDTDYKCASLLSTISYLFNQQNKVDSALTCSEKSLLIKRQIYKTDHVDLVRSIKDLAYFYYKKNNLIKAESLYVEALIMGRKIFTGDYKENDLGILIFGLANCYDDEYKFKEAEPLYKEYLDKSRRIFKHDNGKLADIIHLIGYFYEKISNYEKAETLFKEELEIRYKINKFDNQELACSLLHLGALYLNMADYTKAEQFINKALGMYRKLFKDDNEDLCAAIDQSAQLYFKLADYTKAETLYKEVLNVEQRSFKDDDMLIAIGLNNLGLVYNETGDIINAEYYFYKAFEIRKRIYKADHPDLATSILNMGLFYSSIGALDKAEIHTKNSLNMFRRIYNSDNETIALCLSNLAFIYYCRGKFKEAESLYKEALEMKRRLIKGDNPEVASILDNMAIYYIDMKELNQAESYCKEALEIQRRLLKNDNPGLVRSMMILGIINCKKGNTEKGIAMFQDGLDISRRIYKNIHPIIVGELGALAFSNYVKGDYIHSDSLYNQLFINITEIINKSFSILSEKEREQFYSILKYHFQNYCSLTATLYKTSLVDNSNKKLLSNTYSSLYNNSLFNKAIIFYSTQKVKNRIMNSGDSVTINKYKLWENKKNYISKFYNLSKVELFEKNINLDSIENLANDLEKDLSKNSELLAPVDEKKVYSWIDVQRKLKSDEAAIEIIRFTYFYNFQESDSIYYAALILKPSTKKNSPTNNIELVLFKNGNELENTGIQNYKKNVINKVQDNESYNLFWTAIAKELDGINTVYLSPDGIYNNININSLFNPQTKKYLIDEIDLRLVTSTRDLVANTQEIKPTNTGELFGDPQFNLDSTHYIEVASRYINDRNRDIYYLGNNLDSLARSGISSLPGTRIEVENISKDLTNINWKVNKHLGPDALEEALKAVNNPRILHIATHGKFLQDIEVKNERSFGMETSRFIENPLLRSMLLFSGAENTINRKNNSESNIEDGILTAYEAMNLNLDNTELVVLSACETGLGEVKNGEGVYGLQRAFRQAGAKSIIMSLWAVNDEATQELMSAFYKSWLLGKTKREAFKLAQMQLKDKYKFPYYWAAFVIVGE